MKNHGLPNPEHIAKRVLIKAKPPKPPVNLDRVVRIWSNLNVVEEELDGSGYLLPLGKFGAEIIVNKSDSPERQRFTIAHELGHWVLGLIWKKKSGEFKQPPGLARAHLEKWCDSFATNLLMPRDLIEPWLSDLTQPTFIDRLLGGSQLFNVSEQTFFIRVWELSNIQVLALRQKRAAGHSEFEIEKNYADNSSQRLAAEFLQVPWVQTQLQFGDSIVFFSGARRGDAFQCSGRKLSGSRVILAINWGKAKTARS